MTELGFDLGIGLGLLLLATGVVSGFINTLAGGGSMLTLPILMISGMPADIANGTNRLAVLAQSATGAFEFNRAGRLDRDAWVRVLVPTILGAAIGAIAASVMPVVYLKPVLLGVMMTMAALMLINPAFMQPGEDQPVKQGGLGLVALFGAGLYGGFIQAGVGFILLAALSGVMQYDLVRGNALKTLCTGIFSLVALVVFAWQAQVHWMSGLALAAGSAVGAYLSVKVTLSLSARVLKTILFIMVSLSCVAAFLEV